MHPDGLHLTDRFRDRCAATGHGYLFVTKQLTEVGRDLPRPSKVISQIVLMGYIQPCD
jgi:hypothetical protein